MFTEKWKSVFISEYWIGKNDSHLGNLLNSLFSEFDLVDLYIIYLWSTVEVAFNMCWIQKTGFTYISLAYKLALLGGYIFLSVNAFSYTHIIHLPPLISNAYFLIYCISIHISGVYICSMISFPCAIPISCLAHPITVMYYSLSLFFC